MFTGAYHAPWLGLLHPVTCEHTDCKQPATHDRGGFRFCFDHWAWATQVQLQHEHTRGNAA